jgi:hypothetical protein
MGKNQIGILTSYNDLKLIPEDLEFNYQSDLTSKLDGFKDEFNQNIINEIVLWKVNRYAEVDQQTIKLLNSINPSATTLDIDKTRVLLKRLINQKGIQLPMASTILRFRNKNVFQIIDQRVYRLIYNGEKLKLNLYPNEKNLNKQIDLYLKYLEDLKSVCENLTIPFDLSDRILFMADKRINKETPLSNY